MADKKVSTKKALFTSLLVNVADIIINIVVAIISGSTVMLAQAFQGFSDTSSVVLLTIGHKRSRRTSTKQHPFGFGKEIYFWALLASIIILIFTACLSIYFGVQKFLKPDPVEFAELTYIVLTIGLISNAYAFSLSARQLLHGKHWTKLIKAFHESHQITPKTLVVLDSMGTLATLFGLISLIIYGFTGDGRLDGIGAIAIGVILTVFTTILVFTAKGFITGRSTSRENEQLIKKATLSVRGVKEVLDLRTMALGSGILVNIEVHLQDDLVTDDIEKIIDTVKERVHEALPQVSHIQVEPETPEK